jgi:hypothetical protein
MFLAHHRSCRQTTTIHHESTTNSPQKSSGKHPFSKTPFKITRKAQKKALAPAGTFFRQKLPK